MQTPGRFLALGEIRLPIFLQLTVLLLAATTSCVRSAIAETASPGYLLRYQFREGEQWSWRVVHRASVRTIVAQTDETAETTTQSTKVWKFTKVDDQGNGTFELYVNDVQMVQRLADSKEVRFDSRSQEKPPLGFEPVAKTVGKKLAVITLSPRGEIVERRQLEPDALQSQGYLTVPLPEKPVSLGESWTVPGEIAVPLRSGLVRKIKIQEKFTLQEVKGDLAAIRIATQVLTPVDDPEVEVQLVQRLSEGTVRFDMQLGRIISQEIEVDRQVVGFQGDASSFHYRTRFTEELIKGEVARTTQDSSATR